MKASSENDSSVHDPSLSMLLSIWVPHTSIFFTLDWLALTLLICPFAKTIYLYSAKFHQVLTSSVKNVSL